MFGFVRYELNSGLDKKVATGQVGRVAGLTIGDKNSQNYIYQESNGVMWFRYTDSNGNTNYTNLEQLKKSVVDGKQQLLSTINKYWNLSNHGWTNSAENTNFGNLSDMITYVWNNAVHLTAEEKSITYTYGSDAYGAETVKLTYSKNVAGVLGYSSNRDASYLYPKSISVYNNTVTFIMAHHHGINKIGQNATLTVRVFLLNY